MIEESKLNLAEPPILPLGSEPRPPAQRFKRRMDTKTAAIILLVVVLVPILGGLAVKYVDLDKRYNKITADYKTLNTSYNTLQTEHEDLNATYQILNAAYSTLDQKHTTLTIQYTSLSNQYTNLNDRYTTLNSQYANLNSQYASLLQDYDELSEVFNNPLSYETTLTTTQLRDWLASDSTDSIYYTSPNFICGDFSVMLSQHAKLMHWDIGIVAVWGYTETYQSYAHAFNAIITTEGLVYIEPQNDHYWWYNGHQAIYDGLWWEIDDEWVYVEDCSIIVSYS